jgi:signal transduction histidine kinase
LRLTGSLSRKSAAFLVALAVIAAAFSLASFEYSSAVSTNLSNVALANVNTNAQIQASDLSHLLSQTLEGISENLQIIAGSSLVRSLDVSGSIPLFANAQNSTKDLTSSYFWMDGNGSLVLVSNGTVSTYSISQGRNLSQRAFFAEPKDSGTTFYSSATPSLSNSSIIYLFIAQPIYSNYVFVGVVAAAIELTTLGTFLESQLSPNFKSGVGILDYNGTVLYTGDSSLIGQSVFGSTFQSELPSELQPSFDSFLHQSLDGKSGVTDITYKGATGSLAYQPVYVNESSGHVEQFGVLYITASDTLTAASIALINQQRFISTAIIIGIGATFFGTAFMILRWNKQLGDAVRDKTRELVTTNLQLSSANDQLEAQSKAQTDLINIAAHELRTPTQSILANSELLRGAIVPEAGPISISPSSSGGKSTIEPSQEFVSFPNIPQEEVVGLVESTFRNAQRLERLTQTLLEVARIDNKALRLDYETFDLNDVARELILDMQKGASSSTSPKILFESPENNLMLTADKTKVSQILSNLLSNAIKSSKNGGKISVSTHIEGDSVVVTVADQGKGIDKAILPRLFNKFTTDSGTGLGLFISKSYVEAHGGKITAENNKDGAGATFSFTLPLHPMAGGSSGPDSKIA